MENMEKQIFDFKSVKNEIFTLNLSEKSKECDVVDCLPTGRLVCMLTEEAGILEDHRRELAYFEKSDLNLPTELELKDVVLVMTRCRDITVRFQATQVLRGPVKMVVHDGTVTVSSNIERYFPEIDLKKSRICMKRNSFDSDKLTRAKAAVDLYKS